MENIQILNSNRHEINEIQDFIKLNWNQNHIFTKNKDLLIWQHKCVHNKSKLNFFVGRNYHGKISSILGIIPASLQAKNHYSDLIWLAIWKTLIPTQGISLFYKAIEYYKPKQIGALGINDKIEKLYKKLGFKTGNFSHFYLSLKEFRNIELSKTSQDFTKDEVHDFIFHYGEYEILLSNKINFNYQSFNNLKNSEYLNHRYDKHPFYKYKYLSILDAGKKVIAILIIREINIKGSNCWRVVDISKVKINSSLESRKVRFSILKKMIEEEITYIDLVVSEEGAFIGQLLGFLSISYEKDIIPQHFEPFKMENIKIKYAFKNISYKNYNSNLFPPGIFFKGDSDMDRPNIINTNAMDI